jgi:hypothetical protein
MSIGSSVLMVNGCSLAIASFIRCAQREEGEIE